jgi:LysM repeat protein
MTKFFYRVKENDNLISVSNEFNIPPFKIIALNGINKEIEDGDILYLEKDQSQTVYRVVPTDTLESIAFKFNTTPEKILKDNCLPYLFCGLLITV